MAKKSVFSKSAAVLVLFGMVSASSAMAAPPQADYEANTRVSSPTAFNVEALGRAFAWSLNVDQALDEDMVAGLGYGQAGMKTPSGADTDTHANILPIYLNYYISKAHRSFYGTVGADIITNAGSVAGLKTTTGNVELTSSVAVPNVGVGFENRSDMGFLFRVTGYAFFAKDVKPWMGFTLGYAF
jgi:hypothetical protein